MEWGTVEWGKMEWGGVEERINLLATSRHHHRSSES